MDSKGKRWSLAFACLLILSMITGAWANEELLELQQEPGNWVMNGRTYNGLNYSPLNQINTDNVENLTVAWTFQTGVLDSHEAEPLVIGDTMYLVTPKPNTVYALDLARQGVIKWSFHANQPELALAIERACCGGQTRGLAYAEGKVFFNSLDGHVFALDAETGEVVWDAQNADLSRAETMSTHPLVVHDNVIVGIMGGEYGVRGHVTAYDINTGERKWRFYSMGPDEEMGIGPRFDPYYPDDEVQSPGTTTWYQDSWKTGGGTVWGFFTFDPELNLFYYTTGNCGPWNPDYRRDPITAPGLEVYQNKYCSSLLARDAETGELVWAYSLTPQDQWDLDEPGTSLLIDLEINGELRQALVKPARNGFFYVFDRATGELLHEPWKFTTVTWAHGIDMETGRPIFDEDRLVYTDDPIENLCPFVAARNWENDAYSPETGLIYFTALNRCTDYMVVAGEYVPGQPYRLREFLGTYDGPGGWASELQAWNPATGEKVWGIKYDSAPGVGGNPILATAGNLIFKGSEQGSVEAFNASTGELVWTFRTGSDFQNSPISYIGPDGRQYIAVISSAAPSNRPVDADDPADAAGRFRRSGSTLYVFALPEAMVAGDTAR